MTDEKVLMRVDEGIASITFNRPQVLNALDIPMIEELVRNLQACADEPSVSVVLLTGTGRGFCVGGDMKAAWEHIQAGGDPQAFFRTLLDHIHRAVMVLRSMERPVVAAINGVIAGAGMSLAAACDLRIAAEGARFKQSFTSIGLVPLGGWTVTVAHFLGPSKAAELMMMDPVLEARQALDLGLVSEVVPNGRLIERVRELAGQIAHGPKTAFASAKVLTNAALLPRLKEQMALERERFIYQAGTPDFLEGLTAFIEKREANF